MTYDKTQETGLMLFFADAIGFCGVSFSLSYLKYLYLYNPFFLYGDSVEKISGKLSFLPSYAPVMLSELVTYDIQGEGQKHMYFYFDFWFQMFHENTWSKFLFLVGSMKSYFF